ncbi:MAG: hypothetical protein ACRCT1_07500 [Microcoleaceae cyanobacterium]
MDLQKLALIVKSQINEGKVMDLQKLQNQVIITLQNILNECAYWPDGNCSFPSSLGDALGEALSKLSAAEDETFGIDNIKLHQSLRQLILTPSEAKRESAIDAADSLYLGIFHLVIVPGEMYRTLPLSPDGIDYCPLFLIEGARDKLQIMGDI